MQLNSVNIAGSATPAAAKPLLMQNSAAPISKIFIDDLTERKRLWRIPWFIIIMCCVQCMIGFCLESEQGHWEVGFIYAAGGLSGSLATAYSQPELSLLGASASVYALLASHVPHLMKNYRQLPHRYLRIVSLFILCLSDVGFTAFHYLVNHNMNPRICVEAHIAGGLIGLCFGFLLYSSVKGQGYCADCHLSNT
ncbi:rhomboid-related protein 1 isoform X3 [Anastrepha obliqua]|uniref:rhomboid-related protein 1 isoform X3 n=1 Tax=Anastrepha obliqua TaxID=95512 RepID=UPI002408FE20|nr:rhomboid-related protein 1 isoform X3 [Anastrepha obliqua]